MKKIIFVLLGLYLLTSLTGCKGASTEAAAQKASEPATVCVVAIDGTGSYAYLPKAKGTVRKVIQSLPAGSKVYVRWITEDSVSDKYSIVSAVLPEAVSKSKNAFDLKSKKKVKIAAIQDRQIREQISKIVDEVKSPKALRTDIYGGLYAASVRFQSNPSMRPILILLTDMDDNARKSDAYMVNLSMAEVKVMDFQAGPDDVVRRQEWEAYLKAKGAESVSFLTIDEPINFGR
ncbi:MAG: VWA domain-containing protein [Nitrospirae bacterium]|nr:VWA domain-containing protein [Nitrospirota bacterium]